MTKKEIKVIKILTEYAILINAGSEDGITKESVFDVIGNEEQITDPESGESLGQYYVVKATVKVRTLFSKISECININIQPEIKAVDLLTAATRAPFIISPERIMKLNVDRDQISNLAQSEEPIRIGDKIVLKA